MFFEIFSFLSEFFITIFVYVEEKRERARFRRVNKVELFDNWNLSNEFTRAGNWRQHRRLIRRTILTKFRLTQIRIWLVRLMKSSTFGLGLISHSKLMWLKLENGESLPCLSAEPPLKGHHRKYSPSLEDWIWKPALNYILRRQSDRSIQINENTNLITCTDYCSPY